MIVVRVELHSARTGAITELARMHISNKGDGSEEIGNYVVRALRGRSKAALDRNVAQREGSVLGYQRKRLHVWVLVLWSLLSMKYGDDLK